MSRCGGEYGISIMPASNANDCPLALNRRASMVAAAMSVASGKSKHRFVLAVRLVSRLESSLQPHMLLRKSLMAKQRNRGPLEDNFPARDVFEIRLLTSAKGLTCKSKNGTVFSRKSRGRSRSSNNETEDGFSTSRSAN